MAHQRVSSVSRYDRYSVAVRANKHQHQHQAPKQAPPNRTLRRPSVCTCMAARGEGWRTAMSPLTCVQRATRVPCLGNGAAHVAARCVARATRQARVSAGCVPQRLAPFPGTAECWGHPVAQLCRRVPPQVWTPGPRHGLWELRRRAGNTQVAQRRTECSVQIPRLLLAARASW